jgi:hypothetical protein
MQIEMVQALYEALLPDELPSADRLFNKFNLPPGQAAYIARVLTEKEVPRWRSVALRELRATVEDLVQQRKDVKGPDAKDTYVQQEIGRGAYHELVIICNVLKRKEPTTFVMVESAGITGEFRRAKMSIITLRRIQKHMADLHLGE